MVRCVGELNSEAVNVWMGQDCMCQFLWGLARQSRLCVYRFVRAGIGWVSSGKVRQSWQR